VDLPGVVRHLGRARAVLGLHDERLHVPFAPVKVTISTTQSGPHSTHTSPQHGRAPRPESSVPAEELVAELRKRR
jgi:hypothetical protein